MDKYRLFVFYPKKLHRYTLFTRFVQQFIAHGKEEKNEDGGYRISQDRKEQRT